MDVFFCKLARTNKKLDPTRAPAQGISFRPTQEIAFGTILLAFVVLCPGGLVSICRRYLPHWEEPLHVAKATGAAARIPSESKPSPAEAPQ
jgi:hypothetical protein